MSVRDTIFSALVTRLEAVTVANGYATNVSSPVLRNALPQESVTIPDGYALVSVFDEGDSATISYWTSNKITLETRYVIRAAIASTRLGLVPTQRADNWMGDMRKLAYTLSATPSLLSANVRSVSMDAIQGWNVSETDALIIVPFKILYWIDQAAP